MTDNHSYEYDMCVPKHGLLGSLCTAQMLLSTFPSTPKSRTTPVDPMPLEEDNCRSPPVGSSLAALDSEFR